MPEQARKSFGKWQSQVENSKFDFFFNYRCYPWKYLESPLNMSFTSSVRGMMIFRVQPFLEQRYCRARYLKNSHGLIPTQQHSRGDMLECLIKW